MHVDISVRRVGSVRDMGCSNRHSDPPQNPKIADFYVDDIMKALLRQSYNLLFEKFLLMNFTRRIWMSDEFEG